MRILSFNCHEALNTMWASLCDELHLMYYNDLYYWKDAHRDRPKNVFLYPKGVRPEGKFDVAVGFNEKIHWEGMQWADCPKTDSLAITYYDPKNPKDVDARPPAQLVTDLRRRNMIYCGHMQKRRWGMEGTAGPVIYYGVDKDRWRPGPRDNGRVCVIAHDFRARDNVLDFYWCHDLLKGLPWDVIGRQKDGLPSVYPKNFDGLRDIYENYSIFFDPAHCSPLSFAVIEAMYSGMCIVTRPHDDIPRFLMNGENAIVESNSGILRSAVERLLANRAERMRLGEAARATAEKVFALDRWKRETMGYFRKIGVRGA